MLAEKCQILKNSKKEFKMPSDTYILFLSLPKTFVADDITNEKSYSATNEAEFNISLVIY